MVELRNERYTRVTVTSATSSQTYLTRCLQGRLEDFADEVRIVISKRHNLDKSPGCFLSTDLSLHEQEARTHRVRIDPVRVSLAGGSRQLVPQRSTRIGRLSYSLPRGDREVHRFGLTESALSFWFWPTCKRVTCNCPGGAAWPT